MAHVLIGFGEALPAPEVVFSLRGAGHHVSVFARTRDVPLRHLPLESWNVITSPEDDTAAAIAGLQAAMDGPDAPDLVLPLDDGGLWLTMAAGIAPERVAGASGTAAAAALDKAVQIEAARAAGLSVPETVVLDGEIPEDLPVPGLAKPARAIADIGGRLGKGRVVYLEEGWDRAALEAALTEGPMLVQPLVHGVGEGVFGFVTGDGVIGWSGHRRVRMMNPHGSGSSACARMVPSEALKGQVADFLHRLGWRGAFMVELLRDAQGTAWFMELNGRMWGSLALARRQGLEYPAWAVAEALEPGVALQAPVDPADPGVVRNLGRDLLHLAFVLRGPKSAFHRRHWPSFLRSAAGVLKPARRRQFYNFDPAQPGFLWREAAWSIKRGLKR